MAGEQRYNGWSNYEAWCVNLWIGNEEGSDRYWRGVARECWDEAETSGPYTREENALYRLAQRPKDEFDEANR
jgi:hypothetical protein